MAMNWGHALLVTAIALASCRRESLPYALEFCPAAQCKTVARFDKLESCETYRERFSSACCGGEETRAIGKTAKDCLVGSKLDGELVCELPMPYPTTYNQTHCSAK